ncbi:MAG: hypothetical protein FWF86_07425, partial [Clostridia bacterium]|nr:hypothetical protein [Clostridia bacterium]
MKTAIAHSILMLNAAQSTEATPERITGMKWKKVLGETLLCLGVACFISAIAIIAFPLIDNGQLRLILNSLTNRSRNMMINAVNGLILLMLENSYSMLGAGILLSLGGLGLLWNIRLVKSKIIKPPSMPAADHGWAENHAGFESPEMAADWRMTASKPFLPPGRVTAALPQAPSVRAAPKPASSNPRPLPARPNPYAAYGQAGRSAAGGKNIPPSPVANPRQVSLLKPRANTGSKNDAYRPPAKSQLHVTTPGVSPDPPSAQSIQPLPPAIRPPEAKPEHTAYDRRPEDGCQPTNIRYLSPHIRSTTRQK